MALFYVRNVAVKGIASCVPSRSEENSDLTVFPEGDSAKFIASTGIYRRRVNAGDITTSDLCFHAADNLLNELDWDRSSIDCLIFVTQTPDYILPATSCILQHRLGLGTDVYAIDISLGCSGWVYGMATISQIMSASGMKRGLLLAGDTIPELCSTEDKSAYPIFGDAGTATALELSENEEFKIHTATDGSGYDAIIIPDGGSRNRVTAQSLERQDVEENIRRNSLELNLNGMDVFAFGISKAPQSVSHLLEYSGIDRADVDYYIFHQANMFMNEKIRKKLKLTPEQVPYSLADFGNTSSASIPLTMTTQLSDRLRNGKLKLMACGFGVGLSWGSIYFETDKIVCPELIEI